MPAKARIKLSGTDVDDLQKVCSHIQQISEKYGINFKGPVPLPTKKLRVPVMRTPSGQGTGHGNATWDRWELRVHRRLIDMGADKRALQRVMQIDIPEKVDIEIKIKG